MKVFTLVAIGSFAALAVAAPYAPSYVVHEKRETQHGKWTRREAQLNSDAVIPMSIGLKQRNLEHGYDFLMDVSHPSSPNYGKHWSHEKIAETFASAPETVEAVKEWLVASGIDASRIKLSKGRNWIKFDVTVEEAEALLRTKYDIYTNVDTGNDHLACQDYSIPAHIQEHIDFITPTVHFDANVKSKRTELEKRKMRVRPLPGAKPGPEIANAAQVKYTLANCYQYVTPECLRALYNFTNGTLALSSYGIVEYTPQAYLQSDLNLFYSNLARQIPSGTGPSPVDLIDGAIVQTSSQSFNDNGESDLDLEYAISLVYPQKVTLYQVGDTVESASFNNFLDALDATYCTSGGGDDPNNDSIYPDTSSGGYKGAENCGTVKAAAVISSSYGYNEADLPASYEVRQCNEYMKLGLAGTSFLYSSGDTGVAGNGNQCCTKAKCAGGTLSSSGRVFTPSFPGTCPYVTSVGATQIKPNTAVTATAPEEACQTVIYSGGGFSNVFPIPSYQASAVASYFASHKPTYTATQYNNSQTVRGYPDVAANGANYVVAVDGAISLIYGTSASSPTFGAIITLINEQRAAAGKSALGFLNPALYANPGAFNDITSGGNQGCGTAGFTAVTGWDPVTGLGTPNYGKLLAALG